MEICTVYLGWHPDPFRSCRAGYKIMGWAPAGRWDAMGTKWAADMGGTLVLVKSLTLTARDILSDGLVGDKAW